MHILSLFYVVLFIPNPPVYMANVVIKYSNLSVITGLRVDWFCKQLHTRMFAPLRKKFVESNTDQEVIWPFVIIYSLKRAPCLYMLSTIWVEPGYTAFVYICRRAWSTVGRMLNQLGACRSRWVSKNDISKKLHEGFLISLRVLRNTHLFTKMAP